jgi:hypothetical protein
MMISFTAKRASKNSHVDDCQCALFNADAQSPLYAAPTEERIAMSTTKMTLRVGCGVLIASTLCFGNLHRQSENSADKQPASTPANEKTTIGLVPEVDAAVRAFLDTRFGTIEKPVFHKDLPIDFGAADASK